MRSDTLACLICCALAAPAFGQPLTHIKIETADAPGVARQLMRAGFDVLEGSVTRTSLELVTTQAELEIIQRQGYEPQTIAIGRPFREIQAEQQAADRGVPSGYPDLSAILAEMDAAASTYPAICQVVDLTSTYGLDPTIEDRDLLVVKISDNVADDEDEPACLLVSNHHAREIVTPVIALHTIEQLTTQYGTDPTITALVNEYEIWIAPVWNPDGYEYVFSTDNLWRKNRRVFHTGVGVDLNRNYPFGWDASCGGSPDATSTTYRGPVAASESETQTMIAFANDRRFAKVGDFHSSGREVRYGYGCFNYPFQSFLAQEAAGLSTASGYSGVIGNSCCLGGDIHYHMATNGSHSFLWETHTTFQPTYASAEAEAALVFNGALFFIERPIPLSGHVTDAVTGDPVVANIAIIGVSFDNGETLGSGPRFGRYHVFAPASTFTLEFSASGYGTQTHLVSFTAGTAQVLDVQLVSCTKGDVNNDGSITGLDIQPFVDTLVNAVSPPASYEFCASDMDNDGALEVVDDLQQFVICLLTGPCP